MRIPVSVIVDQIAHGVTFEEILQGYPELEREDIQQALDYFRPSTKTATTPRIGRLATLASLRRRRGARRYALDAPPDLIGPVQA